MHDLSFSAFAPLACFPSRWLLPDLAGAETAVLRILFEIDGVVVRQSIGFKVAEMSLDAMRISLFFLKTTRYHFVHVQSLPLSPK
jgi:hypothetical protein